MLRRDLIRATALGLGVPAAALAQGTAPARPGDFPARPIEFVVAFPPGGGMDVTARIVARHVERMTGHRIVVNNRVGGAGVVAHSYLARQAPADGYTVGIVSSGIFVDGLLRSQGLWSHMDLEILAFLNFDATNWITAATGPLAGLDLRAIIARARENPETIRVSMLPQSSSEFIIEQVERKSGARFVKVPFQGGVPGMTAMLGGHIDIATVFFSEYRSQREAGLVRPVAVAHAARIPNLAEVPTFDEVLGTDNIQWAAWRFAVVPKATPPDRRAYLAAIIQAAVADEEVRREFAGTGVLLDPALGTTAAVQGAASRLAAAQRAFLTESGRLAR